MSDKTKWEKLSTGEKHKWIKYSLQYGEKNLNRIASLFNKGTLETTLYNEGKKRFMTSLNEELSKKENKEFNTPLWRLFFVSLADRESAFKENVPNAKGSGALGYFQIMPKNRVSSNLFTNMFNLVRQNLKYLNSHLTDKDIDAITKLGYDIYGIAGMAHIGGARGAVDFIKYGKNASDGSSNVKSYGKRFTLMPLQDDIIKAAGIEPNDRIKVLNMFPSLDPEILKSLESRVDNSITPPVNTSNVWLPIDYPSGKLLMPLYQSNVLPETTITAPKSNTVSLLDLILSNVTPEPEFPQIFTSSLEPTELPSIQELFNNLDLLKAILLSKELEDRLIALELLSNISNSVLGKLVIDNLDILNLLFEINRLNQSAYGGELNLLPSFRGGHRSLLPVLFDEGGPLFIKTIESKDSEEPTYRGETIPEVVVGGSPMYSWLMRLDIHPESRIVIGDWADLRANDNNTDNLVLDRENLLERFNEVYLTAVYPIINPISYSPNEVNRAKNRAHIYQRPVSRGRIYANTMNLIIAELAHPILRDLGNNNYYLEKSDPNYSAGSDPRGHSRYDYPDRLEGETHSYIEPAITAYMNGDNFPKGFKNFLKHFDADSYDKTGIPTVYNTKLSLLRRLEAIYTALINETDKDKINTLKSPLRETLQLLDLLDSYYKVKSGDYLSTETPLTELLDSALSYNLLALDNHILNLYSGYTRYYYPGEYGHNTVLTYEPYGKTVGTINIDSIKANGGNLFDDGGEIDYYPTKMKPLLDDYGNYIFDDNNLLVWSSLPEIDIFSDLAKLDRKLNLATSYYTTEKTEDGYPVIVPHVHGEEDIKRYRSILGLKAVNDAKTEFTKKFMLPMAIAAVAPAALSLIPELVTTSLAPTAADLATASTAPLWATGTTNILGSMIGGEVADKVSEAITGKTIGLNVENLTNGYVSEFVGDFLNPGYFMGNLVTKGADWLTRSALNTKLGKRFDHKLGNIIDLNLYRKFYDSDFTIPKNIEKSKWYLDLVDTYGDDKASEILNYIKSDTFKSFRKAGVSKSKVLKEEEKFKLFKEINSKLLSLDNNVNLAGSLSLAAQGTTIRPSAGPHDLDFNYLLPDGITLSDINSNNIDLLVRLPSEFHRKVLTTGFPINLILADIPINTNNIFRIQIDGTGKPFRTVLYRYKDMPIDLFLREELITSGLTPYLEILSIKNKWGRPKDLLDISNFNIFSLENPIINTSTGQTLYSPFNFGDVITTEEGLPLVYNIETYPGSNIRVPTIMNWKGEFKPFFRNRGNLFDDGGYYPTNNTHLLNWPALNIVPHRVVADPNWLNSIETFVPSEVLKLWPNEDLSKGYSSLNPYPGENTVIYNPNDSSVVDDTITLDGLHYMHTNPAYEDMYLLVFTSIKDEPLALFEALCNQTWDEKLSRDLTRKMINNENLSSKDLEYIRPAIDGFLRRQFAPDYMRGKNIERGYAEKYPVTGNLKTTTDNLLSFMESILIPEVIITNNKNK